MIEIHSGEFKHSIIIQRKEYKKNKSNIPTEVWNDLLRVRAKIKNISGKEKIIAQSETSIDKKRFYIRYKKGLELSSKDRIVYKKNIYNITYVSDIEDMNKYYEIVCEIVK